MKKLYVLMTALLALFAVNANAERILYSENYEAGGVPATWTINGGTGSIAGDKEGKYFSFALGQNNGRSAHCLWGEAIYDEVKLGLTEYTISIDFQFQAFGNQHTKGQDNGEFAIFSGEKCPKTNGNAGGNWSDFPTVTPNCLFAMTQVSNKDETAGDTDYTHWYINGDQSDFITPVAGTWYNLTLTVNVATREVTYSLEDFDATFQKKGKKTVAEEGNIFASGLYLMNARYQSVINVDNINVAVPGDYANTPVIALTALNKAERTYTISFMKGETLHVTNTDGSQNTAAYDDCEGKYVISTTKSGTISAYTTAGTMTSETATMEVVCEPIVLPVPTYSIIAAEEGYAKTYSFSVDNSNVEMQPVIYIDIKFEGEDGTVIESKNNEIVATIAVPSKGKITVTTKDLNGYYDNGTATILNDIEYTIKHDIDIQHISPEELTAKGFEKMDDLNHAYTSGENNWTARLRMYFSIFSGEKDVEGNDIKINYPVYGFTKTGRWGTKEEPDQPMTDEKYAEIVNGNKNTNMAVAEPIQRYRYLQSKLNETTAHELFAPMYVWYGTTGVDKSYYEEDGVTPKVDPAGNPGGTTNLQVKVGIGIVFSGQVNDAENYNPNSLSYSPILINTTTMGVDGLTDDDMIVVTKITDYGTTTIHPEFPVGTDPTTARTEYLKKHIGNNTSTCKGTETFALNRVDAALSRVLVLSPKNATGIETINYNKVVSDHNAPIYNLNGVQVNPNALQKGIYIKQGKKFIVR